MPAARGGSISSTAHPDWDKGNPGGGDRAIGDNSINPACGLGQGQPPGGGDWAIGDTFKDGNPSQWDRQ
jgi:hypothetical protein